MKLGNHFNLANNIAVERLLAYTHAEVKSAARGLSSAFSIMLMSTETPS